ncbi:MAG TPA: hypothetical protein EYH50_04385 [Pyrodictium delaneyi]|uniref:Uncharacterized protein n=1 Tax=Pyrodictium delaneyi TaxID=1273541 RepID=A0A833E9L4_9CREN|nr:hypothetical protein [Pyrodictium delaneyi]
MITDRLLKIFVALLALSYLGINLVAPLPRFLVAENLLLAAAYTAALTGLLKRREKTNVYLVLLAGFNAGRVSRSIVSPTGELGRLAAEHIPLLALILLVALLALRKTLHILEGKQY